MTIKKTMTDKAIAANQNNGKKGNGPDDSSHLSQNARKHGLQSKHLVFKTDEERQEYDALLNDLMDEYQPDGRTAVELVDKLAVDFWMGGEGNGLAMQELAHRRKAAGAMMSRLAENYDDDQLSLFSEPNGSHSDFPFGWDCQQLVVRTGTGTSELQKQGVLKDRSGKVGHVEIEARLNTSLDTIMRYQAATNRDLFRTIAELQSLQRERREKSVAAGDQGLIGSAGRPAARGRLN